LLKPGGLIVLRHYYRIKPKLVDFKLERRVVLGDDVLAMFVPLPDSPAETGVSGAPTPAPAPPEAAGAAKPAPVDATGTAKPDKRLPRRPRSLKMKP
jgi:hypothetical protein